MVSKHILWEILPIFLGWIEVERKNSSGIYVLYSLILMNLYLICVILATSDMDKYIVLGVILLMSHGQSCKLFNY
jgi:hypothetical protein